MDAAGHCPTCGGVVRGATLCPHCGRLLDEPPPPPPPPIRSGPAFASVGFVIAIVLMALVCAAVALPLSFRTHRVSNERSASAALRTISTSQTDFRANDRDGDRALNFWTYDIYSLFAMVPSEDGVSAGRSRDPNRMIKLIEPSVAAADGTGRPLLPGVLPPADTIGAFAPKASYSFLALERYASPTGDEPYRTDAGNIAEYKAARCWHPDRFGAVHAPVGTSSGLYVFILDESNTLWRLPRGDRYEPRYAPGSFSFRNAGDARGFSSSDPFPLSPAASGWARLD